MGGVKGLREEEHQLVVVKDQFDVNEDLRMELDDGDLVAGRHGEGISSMKVVGTGLMVS